MARLLLQPVGQDTRNTRPVQPRIGRVALREKHALQQAQPMPEPQPVRAQRAHDDRHPRPPRLGRPVRSDVRPLPERQGARPQTGRGVEDVGTVPRPLWERPHHVAARHARHEMGVRRAACERLHRRVGRPRTPLPKQPAQPPHAEMGARHHDRRGTGGFGELEEERRPQRRHIREGRDHARRETRPVR